MVGISVLKGHSVRAVENHWPKLSLLHLPNYGEEAIYHLVWVAVPGPLGSSSSLGSLRELW